MKKLNRILLLALALLTAATVAGCGKKANDADPVSADTDEVEAVDPGVSGAGRTRAETEKESESESRRTVTEPPETEPSEPTDESGEDSGSVDSDTEDTTGADGDPMAAIGVNGDALEKLGFVVTDLPSCGGIIRATDYQVVNDSVADLSLAVGEASRGNYRIAGMQYANEDISGVYTPFTEQKTLSVSGRTVDWNATSSGEYLMRWTDGTFVYALHLTDASESLALGILDDFIDDTAISGEPLALVTETAAPETEPAPEPIRIRYQEESDSYQAAGGESLMTMRYVYPQASGDAAGSINRYFEEDRAAFKAEAADQKRQAEADYAASDNWTAYSLELEYDSERQDEQVVSFSGYLYEYTGGAHPNGGKFGVNFDAETGRKLKLDDIAVNTASFTEFVRSYILDEIQNSDYVGRLNDDYASQISTFIADDSWYLADNGVVFVCNSYIIAPYAAGIFEFTVPYADAAPYLVSDLMP